MADSRLYVFCFGRQSALGAFSAEGFEPGRPVEVHRLGGFAAVATRITPRVAELLDRGYCERQIRELVGRDDLAAVAFMREVTALLPRHAAVVGAAYRCSPVLPMPEAKGIFSSPAHLRAWATKRSKWIEVFLMENAIKDQWLVRGEGEHELAQDQVNVVRQRVYPYTNVAARELTRREGQWMREAWYVWREHQQKWQSGVAQEAERLKSYGLSLEVTGPHPPMHFLPHFVSVID
jgi:hypothetical protein